MKRNKTEREKMMAYIKSQSSKYDCLFLDMTKRYEARDVGCVTDEQLLEFYKELKAKEDLEENCL